MKVLGWIIMIPVVLFILLIVARIAFCGPDQSDVRVMKPMGDAIDKYLTTKGKPSSLDSIPNLPYKLKCSSEYKCSFSNGRKYYKIWIDDNPYSLSLKVFSPSSETGITYIYESSNSNYKLKNYRNNPHIYSSKRTGICNPMKQ